LGLAVHSYIPITTETRVHYHQRSNTTTIDMAETYQTPFKVEGKTAIVTGAGSGISLPRLLFFTYN